MKRNWATLLVLLACGVLGSCDAQHPSADPAATKAYQAAACATCHGGLGEGAAMGPALRNLTQHWNQAEMVDYLTDPKAWHAKSPRLVEYTKRFPMRMPVPDLTPEQRAQVAALILGWK